MSVYAEEALKRISLVVAAICLIVSMWQGVRIGLTVALIASWPKEGTGQVIISGTCGVARGVTYTLTVSGTIGGEAIDYDGISRTC